mgnify:CR=1 FL=1
MIDFRPTPVEGRWRVLGGRGGGVGDGVRRGGVLGGVGGRALSLEA